jgi:hypothetical protein
MGTNESYISQTRMLTQFKRRAETAKVLSIGTYPLETPRVTSDHYIDIGMLEYVTARHVIDTPLMSHRAPRSRRPASPILLLSKVRRCKAQ